MLESTYYPRRVSATIPDNPNWRRHKNACPHYREHWPLDGERAEDGLPLLYQVICLQNTPPLTTEEQHRCLQARSVCWRVEELVCVSRRRG